jgi:hypothetical protein
VVATVTPSRSGAFSATIKLPGTLESGAAVYLRAESVVRKGPGRRTTSATGLVRGIKLTP